MNTTLFQPVVALGVQKFKVFLQNFGKLNQKVKKLSF